MVDIVQKIMSIKVPTAHNKTPWLPLAHLLHLLHSVLYTTSLYNYCTQKIMLFFLLQLIYH